MENLIQSKFETNNLDFSILRITVPRSINYHRFRAAPFFTKLIATRRICLFLFYSPSSTSLIHLWTNRGWIHWRTKGLEVQPPGANNLKSKERFLERLGRIVSKAASKRVEGLYRSFYCCEEEVEHSTSLHCRFVGQEENGIRHGLTTFVINFIVSIPEIVPSFVTKISFIYAWIILLCRFTDSTSLVTS